MTYRESADVTAALERPPQIFGFALYVMGTGALLMGLAQIVAFARGHHVGWNLGVAVRAAIPVGELMVALGLAIAWRTTKGSGRRLLAVAGVLWVTLFLLELRRTQVRSLLVETLPRAANASYVATWAGWAIALGLVAVVVFRGGRAFAARTWAPLLGATLVTAHAFEQAWPILVPLRGAFYRGPIVPAPGLVVLGGVGLVVFAGGLYAAGRSILRGVTVDEYVRAASKKRDRSDDDGADVWTPALLRGLPLLVDASVATSGLAVALALAVVSASYLQLTAHRLVDTAVIGGQIVASALLVVAVRRVGRLGARPIACAYGALASLVACLALLAAAWTQPSDTAYMLLHYVNGLPPLLVAGTLWTTSTALGTFTASAEPVRALRSRLRAAAVSLAASGAALFLATHTADPGARSAFEIIAALGGGLALASTLAAAGDGRRVEVALAAPAAADR